MLRHVASHERPPANDRPCPDRNALHHACPYADDAVIANTNGSSKMRARLNENVVSENTIVVDGCSGIENTMSSGSGERVHDCTRHDNGTWSERGGHGDHGSRVYRTDGCDATPIEVVDESLPYVKGFSPES